MTSGNDVTPLAPPAGGQSSSAAGVSVPDEAEPIIVSRRPGRVRKYERIAGVDLLRGLLMLMLGLGIGALTILDLPAGDPVRQALSNDGLNALEAHVTGSTWRNEAGPGLIFASDFLLSGFLFVAGISLTLWRWKQKQKKADGATQVRAIINRVGILILAGLFLQSLDADRSRLVLTDPLIQIGLATLVASLFLKVSSRWGWVTVCLLLIAHTMWFYLATVPEYGEALKAQGLITTRATHYLPPGYEAFAFHRNIADYTDRVWLSYLPGQPDAEYRMAGRVTWNFIPGAAIMLCGLLVGRRLMRRDSRPIVTNLLIVLVGIACVFASLLFDSLLAPAIERLMTISWVILALGYSLIGLGLSQMLTDSFGLRKPILPLLVLGRHSLLAYLFLLLGAVWLTDEILKHAQTVGDTLNLRALPLTMCLLQILLPVTLTIGMCALLEERTSNPR